MSAVQSYIAATGVTFLFLGSIWNEKTWLNLVLKVAFFLFAACALLILDARL